MPVEIEAKLKVADLDAMRHRLRQCGATPAGRVLETNTFFDTEDRSLLAADQGLRLRRAEDLDSDRQQFIVTYKGPNLAGPLKSREEIELTVDDHDAAVTLLDRLGYSVVVSFQKRRESWTLADCRIELDELPHLGTFVEIEGPGEEAILKVRQTLGLADSAIVKASYIALLLNHLAETGKQTRRIVF